METQVWNEETHGPHSSRSFELNLKTTALSVEHRRERGRETGKNVCPPVRAARVHMASVLLETTL